MKRKFKLFATVASLCLSVALMAFGVYAASQVTYTVNGTVSYTLKSALVDIKTTTAYMVTEADGSTGVTDGHLVTPSVTDLTTGKNYSTDTTVQVGGQDVWTSYDTDTKLLKEDPNGTATITDLSFNTSTVWRITINVKTLNETGVHVKAEATLAEGETKNYGILPAETYSDVTVSKDDAGENFVFYVYLINPAVNITSAPNTFSILLSIDQSSANLA